MPRAGRVARVRFTGHAFEQEVTVGDTLDTLTLPTLRETIRRSIGDPATLMPDVADAIVDAALLLWPSDWASLLARSKSFEAGQQFYHLAKLVEARCLEYLEWRYGVHPNVTLAIQLLLAPVVNEVAMFWLEGPQHRNVIRQAIAAIRRADRA